MGARTNVDDTAARRSARDQWEAVAHREFRAASNNAHSDPGRTLEVLRKVLEAWAFALLSIQDPTFKPYKGDKPRKEQLAKALIRLSPQFPLAVRDAVLKLKPAADSAHHATSQLKIISPEVVQEMLRHGTTLLDYLDTQTDLPAAVEAEPIPAQPGGAGRTRYVLGAGLGAMAVVGISATAWYLLRTDAGPSPLPASAPSTDELPAVPARNPALAWVDRYETDIASQDVERVVRNMRFPLKSFFGLKDVSETDVRKQTAKWFTTNSNTKTFFDNCREVASPAKETYTVRCDVRLEPALKEALAPQCFVFDSEGLLVSRTDSKSPESCPP